MVMSVRGRPTMCDRCARNHFVRHACCRIGTTFCGFVPVSYNLVPSPLLLRRKRIKVIKGLKTDRCQLCPSVRWATCCVSSAPTTNSVPDDIAAVCG